MDNGFLHVVSTNDAVRRSRSRVLGPFWIILSASVEQLTTAYVSLRALGVSASTFLLKWVKPEFSHHVFHMFQTYSGTCPEKVILLLCLYFTRQTLSTAQRPYRRWLWGWRGLPRALSCPCTWQPLSFQLITWPRKLISSQLNGPLPTGVA